MIFTISGPSGCGKTSLVRALASKKNVSFVESISCTTRAPREKEIDNVDYHFMTKDEFEAEIKKGNFIEYTEFGGNYYGTHINDIESANENESKNVLIVADRQGAMSLKERYGKRLYTVYLMIPKEKAYKRLKRRDGTKKALARQKVDEENELYNQKGYDFIIDADRQRHEVVYDFIEEYKKIREEKNAPSSDLES